MRSTVTDVASLAIWMVRVVVHDRRQPHGTVMAKTVIRSIRKIGAVTSHHSSRMRFDIEPLAYSNRLHR